MSYVQRLWVIWGHCCPRVAAAPSLPNGPITQLSPYLTRKPGTLYLINEYPLPKPELLIFQLQLLLPLLQGTSIRLFPGCVKPGKKVEFLITFCRQKDAIFPPHILPTWEELFRGPLYLTRSIIKINIGSRQQLTACTITIQCFTATFDQVLMSSPVNIDFLISDLMLTLYSPFKGNIRYIAAAGSWRTFPSFE